MRLRILLGTAAALVLVAALTALAATQWPDALGGDGVHGWLPWVQLGQLVAWPIAVGGLGAAMAQGVERPAHRTLRYLGAAAVATLTLFVVSIAGLADDPAPAGARCGVAAAGGVCHDHVWWGAALVSGFVLLLCVIAFAVVALAAATTQAAWLERRAHARRFGVPDR